MWNINWRTFGGRVFGRAVRVMLALCSIRVYFVCLYRPASGRGMRRECLMHVCLSVRMSVFDKWKGGLSFPRPSGLVCHPNILCKDKGANWLELVFWCTPRQGQCCCPLFVNTTGPNWLGGRTVARRLPSERPSRFSSLPPNARRDRRTICSGSPFSKFSWLSNSSSLASDFVNLLLFRTLPIMRHCWAICP